MRKKTKTRMLSLLLVLAVVLGLLPGVYNGPRDSDHGWQKDREHGRISESTERGNEPWHEQRTARSSKQNWSWRY